MRACEWAISDFSRGIRLDSKNASAYVARGSFWLEEGDHKKALSDFSDAARLDPKRFDVNFCLAWIYAASSDDQCRDGTKALEHATKACEASEWKNDFAIAVLAAACAELGDWNKAVMRQEQCFEVSKDEESKEEERKILELYKAKQPLRQTSFKRFFCRAAFQKCDRHLI